MVMTKSLNTGSDQAGEGPSQGAGRGQRKQLMITMAAKKVNTLLRSLHAETEEVQYMLH